MRTITQIIKDAGGAEKIAQESNGVVKTNAVYKWQENGVSDRHWPLLIRLADTAAVELFAANTAIRDAHAASESAH